MLFRNLDKLHTFTAINIAFLFVKTISDTIARLLIFGCFMYVIKDGAFSSWMVCGAYYGSALVLFIFNLVFAKVSFFKFKTWEQTMPFLKMKDCRPSTLINIMFDSLSSVLSYNSFDLKHVHGKNSDNSMLNHVSGGGKQFLYNCLCSLVLFM